MRENARLIEEAGFTVSQVVGVTLTVPWLYRQVICKRATRWRWLHDACEPIARMAPSLAMLDVFFCQKPQTSVREAVTRIRQEPPAMEIGALKSSIILGTWKTDQFSPIGSGMSAQPGWRRRCAWYARVNRVSGESVGASRVFTVRAE